MKNKILSQHMKSLTPKFETDVQTITLFVKLKDGKFINIPFNEREIHDLYDILYMADDKDLKMNKIKLDMDKWDYIMHDVIGNGTFYNCVHGKLVKRKGKNYVVRKPKWKVDR